MDYKFWKNEEGRSPVLKELEDITLADANSGKSYWLHLNRLKKYTFEQLLRHRIIKKLKGKNLYKLFELRFYLPRKIARTFFVVGRDASIWLLHLKIKKKDETNPTDIVVAEQRAAILNQSIHYL